MNNKNVLLGIIGGVAAGALIAMLVSNKGKATVKRLTQEGEDYFGGLKDKYGDLLERLNDKLDALKGEANASQASKY